MADPIAFEVEWGAVYLAISAVRVETLHRSSYRRDMLSIWPIPIKCRWPLFGTHYLVVGVCAARYTLWNASGRSHSKVRVEKSGPDGTCRIP